MKTSMKALTLVLCAVLLVCASVMGTLAYLQSKTEVVTNTFTVGNVTITLNETPVDVYGAVVAGEPVMGNEYKLIPGHTYTKDPTIHVKAGSEQCYLFVKVVDGLAGIQAADTVAAQMAAKGWVEHPEIDNVWYKADSVDAREGAIDVEVFDTFTIMGNAKVEEYVTETIKVQAYAIQADGFASAVDAYAAAPCNWTI